MQRFLIWCAILMLMVSLSLPAQTTALNGTWHASLASGAVRQFSFHSNGDNTFSGGGGTSREPDEFKFDNGKIENGQLSFSTHDIYYTGKLVGERLELTEELRFGGYKAVRKPGDATASESFDGEWTIQNIRFTFNFKVNGDKAEGTLSDLAHNYTTPIYDGSVHGRQMTFRYKNNAGEPAQMLATLAEDHLDITNDLKRTLHAERVPAKE